MSFSPRSVTTAVPASPRPAGPPHVGARDELLRANKQLFHQLEQSKVEMDLARFKLEQGEERHRDEQQQFKQENEELLSELFDLRKELAETREKSVMEKDFLEYELSRLREEHNACVSRLEKTHEALGITADKARALETSHGRLQIDLNGTLSTMEEASRRHELEIRRATAEARQREAELQAKLDLAAEENEALKQQLDQANDRVSSYKAELSRTVIGTDAEKLSMRHAMERLTERLEAAEGAALDPSVLSNVQFAASHSGKTRGSRAFSLAMAPSGMRSVSLAPARGRLQNMVPPTYNKMASPAPR